MRILRKILILALAILSACYIGTRLYLSSSDRKDPPVIKCPTEILEVSASDDESKLLTGVTAADPQDGDLTNHIIVGGISKLISNNTAKVTLLVFDSDDNMGMCVRYIRYTDYQRPLFFVAQPLVYSSVEEVTLIERVGATDVVDGDISQRVRVSSLSTTDNSEIYDVTIQVTNSMGDTSRLRLPVVIQPTNPLRPVITLSSHLVYVNAGSEFDPASYVTAVTASQTSVDVSQVSISSDVNTAAAGTYRVVYTYSANGSTGTAILTVVVQ
jgi:hypothetical protein